jgi:hypothetical protein
MDLFHPAKDEASAKVRTKNFFFMNATSLKGRPHYSTKNGRANDKRLHFQERKT